MPKRTRNTKNIDTVQNARRVFLEAVESTETVELTVVQQVMRDMCATCMQKEFRLMKSGALSARSKRTSRWKWPQRKSAEMSGLLWPWRPNRSLLLVGRSEGETRGLRLSSFRMSPGACRIAFNLQR